MKHAGLVLGYAHVCRRKGCTHRELANEAELRRCPKHGMKLWPKARVRPIRFHDLRHTTASLLMMSGANPAAVQRILRHSDPRITTEVYGHLAPEYLRAEIDRLRFFPEQDVAPAQPVPAEPARAINVPLGPRVVQEAPRRLMATGPSIAKTLKIQRVNGARPAGLEPATRGLEGLVPSGYSREFSGVVTTT